MRDDQCDILIVGSGAGGLTAAITAKLLGLNAMLIEKLPHIGGSSAMSGGVLWLPDNPLMRREGISDSREAALTYLANFVSEDDPASTAARREAFVDGVAPLFEMFESQGLLLRRCHGYSDYYDTLPGGVAAGRSVEADVFDAKRLGPWKERFKRQNFPIPVKVSESAKLMLIGANWEGKRTAARIGARTVWAKIRGQTPYSAGAALQGRMLEIALRLGCDIRTGAKMVDLESENGKVVGALVELNGRRLSIRASRGVLVAAGDFARNSAMRKQYQQAPISADWTHANPGNTGEAIQALAKVGAALGYMNEAWWVPGFVDPDAPEGSSQVIPELHKPHVVVVDQTGHRFVNESVNYMAFGRACYARNQIAKAVPCWAILDATHRKRYIFAQQLPGRVPKRWLDKGLVKQAQSIEGLAAQCGIDPAGLLPTIARWNAMCERGVDEDFGKGSSAYNRYYGDPGYQPNPCMGPVKTPDFWAARIQIGDVGTCGGAITDEHARVRRPDSRVIDGLYAAGNCAAPIAGAHYIGAGHSIACSAIFGMLAVRHMAG